MLVQRHGTRGDAMARKQGARRSRVLACDEVGPAQHLDRARARIGEIADGRGDDEKNAGHSESTAGERCR
jgi:hypothetical protein